MSGLLGAEAGHVVAHGDALVEGLQEDKLHDPSEVGLTGHKRFFVFPDRLESAKVRGLNSSTAKNLPACALVGPGKGLSTA